MSQVIFLSVVFLSCFIDNNYVLAGRKKDAEEVKPVVLPSKDPRVDPLKFCDFQCIPTMRPKLPFNATQAAGSISIAIKGAGTDENTLITVLTSYGLAQRIEIIEAYKNRFGAKKDMPKDIKHDISGKFDESVVALLTPIPIFYAQEIHTTITDKVIDESTLVEILCTISNFGIKSIVEIYQNMYSKSLESDLTAKISGNFQKLLVLVLQANREENQMVDNARAATDAQALISANGGRWGTDATQFNSILASRSYGHLRQVFAEYLKITGQAIEQSIKLEFPKNAGVGYLALVQSIINRPRFFAEQLDRGMKGKGVHDRTVIRIIVSRSEIDLGDIRAEFQKFYKKQLDSHLNQQVGGNYRRVLTTLVKGNSA